MRPELQRRTDVIASAIMVSGVASRFRHPSRLFGLLAVLVALVSQLALGSMVIPDEQPSQTQLGALDAASSFCQSGHPPGGSGKPIPHHAADYALCALSVALALPSVILASDPHLPGPGNALPLRLKQPQQARAPPRHGFAAAYPRGPPDLV
ncbi:MAG: hypothetical protein ACJ8H8_09420 [Geminicoccaceae bacterium]